MTACSLSDPTPSLAQRLEQRYDGEVRCIEAVVNQVDETTASTLKDNADQGLDTSGVWYEAPLLEAFGRIIAC